MFKAEAGGPCVVRKLKWKGWESGGSLAASTPIPPVANQTVNLLGRLIKPMEI